MNNRSFKTKEEKARIVMEMLSSTETIAEISRKYNTAVSLLYKWRDSFIEGETSALEPGRSSEYQKSRKEINDLKKIIGELTVANETLKKTQLMRKGGRQ